MKCSSNFLMNKNKPFLIRKNIDSTLCNSFYIIIMFKNILSVFGKSQKTITIRIVKGSQLNIVLCKVDSNLMDVTNALVNQNVNVYGLCDKQLACTTCRVDIQTISHEMPPPSDEEIDVLITTRNFNQKTSRMACQVTITEQLEGMVVRIPESKQKSS